MTAWQGSGGFLGNTPNLVFRLLLLLSVPGEHLCKRQLPSKDV